MPAGYLKSLKLSKRLARSNINPTQARNNLHTLHSSQRKQDLYIDSIKTEALICSEKGSEYRPSL